jgi:glycosyltransferase XagB
MSHLALAEEPAEGRPDRAIPERPPRDFAPSRLTRTPMEIPIEIAFLEYYGVGRPLLSRATEAAERSGVGADAALLGEGLVSDEHFYQALAMRLRAPYYSEKLTIDENSDVEAAIRNGFALLKANDLGLRAVVSPRGAALRFLLEAEAAGRPQPPIAICSRQRLTASIRARSGERVARKAAFELKDSDPSLTASAGLSLAQIAVATTSAGLAIGLWLGAPDLLRLLIWLGLWLVFVVAVWLRWTVVVAAREPHVCEPLRDDELPVYTVVAALYKEGRVVRELIRALDAIDYPRAKLDIKLVVELRDAETLTAIAALRLPPRYDVIVAPPGEPSTKPRALNVALPAARGDLIVIYDAEDEPDSNQLRLAAARFATDLEIDALQARLTIHNATDYWLSELFAIEYAVLFDFVNPGLAALDLPIALGGSSNHFRTRTLRRVGGWDAWNVTEDADLGLRLARFGARVGALASDTAEEAPNDLKNWFRQRVRWQKGWLQTLIVHSRHPIRFVRELGWRRALAASALITGTVLGGLFGPPLLADALARAFRGGLGAGGTLADAEDVVTYILTLSGVQAMVIPALVAMRRRGMKGAARAMALMPVYYALVCLATWAALFDLALRPFHWAKTEHGRARGAARKTTRVGLTASRPRGREIAD